MTFPIQFCERAKVLQQTDNQRQHANYMFDTWVHGTIDYIGTMPLERLTASQKSLLLTTLSNFRDYIEGEWQEWPAHGE